MSTIKKNLIYTGRYIKYWLLCAWYCVCIILFPLGGAILWGDFNMRPPQEPIYPD